MSSLTNEQLIAILQRQIRNANQLLAQHGWTPFGTHSGLSPVPKLEFSSVVDDDGLPCYERLSNGEG